MDCIRKELGKKQALDGRMRLIILAAILTLVILANIVLNCMMWNEEGEKKVVKNWKTVVSSRQDNEKEIPMKRLPQAIIIGSRKSGTRALLKFLTANPNIRAANKEVHFFDRMHNYRLGLDWYREQMPASLVGQITIEKSPAYFVTKGVPERIKAMNASVKLILVVRNPVKRLISDFSQLVAHKLDKEFGFNGDYDDYYHYMQNYESPYEHNDSYKWMTSIPERVWLQAETSFENYVRRSDGAGINEQRRAIKAGMYSDHLERWLNQYNRDQFHLVDGERLISDPASELREVESFLGLAPTISSADFIFNQKKGFFCLATRRGSSSLAGPASGKSDLETDSMVADSVCLGDDKGRQHVKVKKSLSNELHQFYAPSNEYLYSLVGKNFNWSQVQE